MEAAAFAADHRRCQVNAWQFTATIATRGAGEGVRRDRALRAGGARREHAYSAAAAHAEYWRQGAFDSMVRRSRSARAQRSHGTARRQYAAEPVGRRVGHLPPRVKLGVAADRSAGPPCASDDRAPYEHVELGDAALVGGARDARCCEPRRASASGRPRSEKSGSRRRAAQERRRRKVAADLEPWASARRSPGSGVFVRRRTELHSSLCFSRTCSAFERGEPTAEHVLRWAAGRNDARHYVTGGATARGLVGGLGPPTRSRDRSRLVDSVLDSVRLRSRRLGLRACVLTRHRRVGEI